MNNEKAIDVIVAICIVGAVVFGLNTCFPSKTAPVQTTEFTTSVSGPGLGGFVQDNGLGGAGGSTETDSNNSCGM